MSDKLIFGYSASSNISFRGTVETEIDLVDWKEMSSEEQNQIMDEVVYDLIDVWTNEED